MEQRNEYWDNLKFFLIVLVVVGHFYPGIHYKIGLAANQLIYLFHMPLFIFISGVFHKDVHVLKRVIGLLLTGVAYNIVLGTIDAIILDDGSTFSLFQTNKIPWFLFCIAICNTVTYLIRSSKKVIVLIMAILIGSFAGYDTALCGNLILANTVVWYPFYLMGNVLACKKDIAKKLKLNRILGG